MKADRRPAGLDAPSSIDRRRRSPRLEVVDAIESEIRLHNVPITLLNIGQGGFLMRSPVAYVKGDTHKFRFILRGEYPIVLRGRVAHLTRVTTKGTPAYVVGVEFMDQQVTVCQQAIDVLVAAASRRR